MRISRNTRHRSWKAAVLTAVLLLAGIERPTAVSTGLVISQVYGGGGNSGAPYTHDFVEIHNLSPQPMSLAGLSVQYASATGTGHLGANASQLAPLPDVTIASGGYFLVQLAGGTNGAPLPAPDVVDTDGPINMSATGGKVALVTGTSSLGCNGGSAPCSPAQLSRIVDLVGYGSANFFEGAPAAAPSNTTAAIRTAGNIDTDNNAADFIIMAPSPRSGGGSGDPTISVGDESISEGNGLSTLTFTVALSRAAAVDVVYSIETEDESAVEGLDYLQLSLAGQVIPAGSLTATHEVTIVGDTAPEPTETFSVVLSEVSGAEPGDLRARGTITNDDLSLRTIHELQGSGDASPFADADVATRGIVTARKTNGFFIQTPDGERDDDPRTSEALFVFTSTLPAVTVGDAVEVSGRLVEFRSSSATTAGTLTEITGPAVTVLSSGHKLPTAIDIGAVLSSPGDFSSRAEQLERYEGMLLATMSMNVVGPTNTFGELFAVLPGAARPFREPGVDVSEPLPAEAPPSVPRFDGNFERLMLDTDDLVDAAGMRRASLDLPAGSGEAPVQVRNVFGPLDYAFDSYRVAVDPTAVAVGQRTPVPVAAPKESELTVAALNLENFRDGTANFAGRKEKAARLIVEILRSPDVLGLIEVGDLEDLQELAALVNVAAGTDYRAYLLDGDGQSTGFEQNIGYLVNDARVQVFSTYQVYQGKTFTFAGQTDLLHDRPPFVLEARVIGTGTPLTVVLNHLRSLIDVNSSAPIGNSGLTVGARVREKRRLQAEDLADLISTRINENLVVLGDMNAFEFNDGLVDVIGTLQGSPAAADQVTAPSVDRWSHSLVDLVTLLPAAERYSYVFEGNAQVLDHVLVNQAMRDRLTRFTYARANADFPERFESDLTSPTRLSDHDAAVASFGPLADLAVETEGPFAVQAGERVSIRLAAINTGDTAATVSLSVLLSQGLTWQNTTAPAGWTCATAGETVTCQGATLASGSRAVFDIAAVVPCTIPDGTTVAVPAIVSSPTRDANTGNNAAAAAVTISNPPPVISGATASRTRLPAPLHQMVPVKVRYDARDSCGDVTSTLRVTSNEPVTGFGQGLSGLTSPDWEIIDAHRVRLRSERSPRGNGRVYTIAIVAEDSAGGTATTTLQVLVPR